LLVLVVLAVIRVLILRVATQYFQQSHQQVVENLCVLIMDSLAVRVLVVLTM
jgi:hypothetical protein